MAKLVKCDAVGCKDPLISAEEAYQVQIGKGTWGKDRTSASVDVCNEHYSVIASKFKLEFKEVKRREAAKAEK